MQLVTTVLNSAGLDHRMLEWNNPVYFLLQNAFYTPSPSSDVFKSIFLILFSGY